MSAAFFFLRPIAGGPPAPGEGVRVDLSMAGFDPPRIEVQAGESVTLRLVNRDNRFHTDGGGWHQFAIDEMGIDVRVAPLQTQTVTLTPTRAGTVEFYCDICCGGRENPYMRGRLVVRG
ncbi:cytochrome C oxidase subunit II [Limnochorda pilosa]|uniref:Cytochrome C oxidase subunit II n=1 Tax=Limnochorda pilosa TaxID=1555112 RepID=A0A0K2SQ65_LIMPI|nr:cytochrome C oxidase subunit II [Limnochorda pilosa]